MDIIKIGVLTLSDRAYKGVYEDISGENIKQVLEEFIANKIDFVYEIIPDEQDLIEKKLIYLADSLKCDLICTTGGTGPAPRDVTPEATKAVCKIMLPGFGEQMRTASLKYVPTAILSRQEAGVRGQSLIINLPGKPKAIRECLEPIFGAIPYCLDLIGAGFIEAKEGVKIFRPKK